MQRLVLRRLALSIPLLFLVSALTFFLLALVPGDAALIFFGSGGGTPEQVSALREQLGLNQPIWVQYAHWLGGALRGDFGTSLFGSGDVLPALNRRLAVTLSLVVCAVGLSAVMGVPLGVVSARRVGWLGRAIDTLSLATFGMPSFWTASLLVVAFAVAVPVFPATGYVTPGESVLGWIRSLALPVIALALHGTAVVAKQTRDAMHDVLQRGFVRNLRANGISERSIVWKHALRNAGLPIVTVLGLQFVGLLGGSVAIETVFALPGIGSLLVLSAERHDVPMIQGIAVYFTLIVVIVNLGLDVFYGWLDPKVRVT